MLIYDTVASVNVTSSFQSLHFRLWVPMWYYKICLNVPVPHDVIFCVSTKIWVLWTKVVQGATQHYLYILQITTHNKRTLTHVDGFRWERLNKEREKEKRRNEIAHFNASTESVLLGAADCPLIVSPLLFGIPSNESSNHCTITFWYTFWLVYVIYAHHHAHTIACPLPHNHPIWLDRPSHDVGRINYHQHHHRYHRHPPQRMTPMP